MRFIGRSLFGLFLIALTCGLLATAAGLIYSSFQERAAKQGNKRPQKERIFSAHVMEAKASKIQPGIEAFGERVFADVQFAKLGSKKEVNSSLTLSDLKFTMSKLSPF